VDRWPGTDNPCRPKLYAPKGAIETFRRVVGSWGNEDLIENAFDIEEYHENSALEIGSVKFHFHAVPHFIETFAVCAESTNGGGKLTYGADCRPTDTLVRFAHDTDLLLIEGTLPRPERTGQRGHLTPREAGEHGKAAGARRLVLTHISDELDWLWAVEEATNAFGSKVDLATEGAVYEV
jgi:ribonuclease BN (tRNA processing enzyme)